MKKIAALLLVVSVVIAPAFRYASDTENANLPIRGMIEDYYVLGAKTQVFKINGALDQTILGTEGTRIQFAAGSFMYESGEPHNCGSIVIRMREYCNKADCAASGMTMHSSKRMLESAGMVYVEAFCVGKRLLLRPGRKIKLLFPLKKGQELSGMQLFDGKMDQNGLVDWIPASGDDVFAQLGKLENPEPFTAVQAAPDSINYERYTEEGDYIDEESSGYVLTANDSLDCITLQTSKMGWINCDRFYDVPDDEKTDVFVKVNSFLKDFNVRLVFKDINCIMPGYAATKKDEYMMENIPRGKKAFLLVYSKFGQQVAYSMQEITVGENALELADLKMISIDEFKRNMQSLNTTTP